MATDVMRVRLHLRRIRVLEVVEDTPTVLRVQVESTQTRVCCPHCGFKCHKVHDTRERQVRDLEVSGRQTTLVWTRRRVVCGNCSQRFLEDHDEFDGRLTRRLAHRLVADAQVMSIRAVVRCHGVHWAVVNTLVRAWSGLIAAHRRSQRCKVLLVDETSMRKRHRYVTVIVNGDTGHTLAMVQHRSSAALTQFLMSQPHRWRRGVKVVVSDGSGAYKASIGACLPHARHVLDRFGVIRWFTAGLAAVRRGVQRRHDGTEPVFDPEVFRARFLLARRGDTLGDTDQARLDKLFETHPRLQTGWQALQELHGLYLADDHHGALEALDRFCDLYETGELPEHQQHRRHHHRLVHRNLGLAPHRPSIQRTDRKHQQPPTSPTTNRPRLHQPHQLRSPRTPDNMTHQPIQQPHIPRLRAGPKLINDTGWNHPGANPKNCPRATLLRTGYNGWRQPELK